jgi:hypothetical protein
VAVAVPVDGGEDCSNACLQCDVLLVALE